MGGRGSKRSGSGESELKVKDYFIEDFLGEGGFSKVYRGRHSATGQRVALKMLKQKVATMSDDKAKQVKREVDAMSRAVHPNILRLIEVDWDCELPTEDGKTQKAPLLVIELAEGGDLFEFLMFTGGFDERSARTYFRQLVAALKACHKFGVVHRDLKPENLLLDGDFKLKIADFGLAHVRSGPGAHVMSTVAGTKSYMAPEVLAGRTYNESADVFSAGVLMFLMIAGFPPFQFATSSDWWFDKLQKRNFPLFWKQHSTRAKFSDEAKRLIERLLAADASARITLSEIEDDPWFKGEVIPLDELKAEMTKRKDTVLKSKSKEKEAKAKKEARKGGREKSAMEEVVSRSLGDVDMPLHAPMMFVPAPDCGDDEEEAEIGQTIVTPKGEVPAFEEKDADVCYTRLELATDPAAALKPLRNALGDLSCRYEFAGADWMFKGKYVNPETGDKVQFNVLLYKSEAGTIVELKRVTGSVILFGRIFDDLLVELADHLRYSE